MSPAFADRVYATEPSGKPSTVSWILTEVFLLALGISSGSAGAPGSPLDWSHILITDVQSWCHKEIASTGTGHLPMATRHHGNSSTGPPCSHPGCTCTRGVTEHAYAMPLPAINSKEVLLNSTAEVKEALQSVSDNWHASHCYIPLPLSSSLIQLEL